MLGVMRLEFDIADTFNRYQNAISEKKINPYLPNCRALLNVLNTGISTNPIQGRLILSRLEQFIFQFEKIKTDAMRDISLELKDCEEYYAGGMIIIPQKTERLYYHVARISLPANSKNWYLDLLTKEGFWELETAVSFAKKKGTLAIAKNSEKYPFCETALPVAGYLFIEGYEKSFLKRNPEKSHIEAKEIIADTSIISKRT